MPRHGKSRLFKANQSIILCPIIQKSKKKHKNVINISLFNNKVLSLRLEKINLKIKT